MNAAPCGSDLTSIGGVPEKCCRISPDLYYTISVEGTGPQGQLQAQGHLTSFAIRHRGPGHSISRRWEGELAVPRSGRRSLRPTANFSRPRAPSHRLPLGIEALGKYTIKNLRWAICSPQVWLGWLESNQHAQSQSLLSYH